MTTPQLQLRQVSRTYGQGATQVHALTDVDLAADRGEMIAVMGPSGSGKSTLLTIAGTLERPTSGQVLIDGTDVGETSSTERARLRRQTIGYVFQEFNLLAGLTAAENVAMPLELDGIPTRHAQRTAHEVLDHLDLTHRADHFPDDMSGGERQRVAIGRAIIGNRRLLLADEPSGALDSVTGEAVMRLLRDTTRRGVTIVVATHDAQFAAWADRVIFLRDGAVVDRTTTPPGPEALIGPDTPPGT